MSLMVFTLYSDMYSKYKQAQIAKLQTASSANLGSSRNLLSIAIRISRSLNLLAQGTNSHCLPAANTLHLGDELASGASGFHVTSNVLVDGGTLLEDANAVMVGTNTVVVVL